MTTASSSVRAREEEIFQEQITRQHRSASRMFAWIMLLQWAAAVAAALFVAPHTWIGHQQVVHQHVWLAVILGGVLASLPVAMALTVPDGVLTRHLIAAAQMVFSALLIHLTGGRIETHFHVFGSIALLFFYRDWKVIVTATIVVAVDHALRNVVAPLSVFGVQDVSRWRWVEHAAWVLFEDAFLIPACIKALAERREIAARQARLEEAKAATQREVEERTAELNAANQDLQQRTAALAYAATHDKLTGLPNRAVLRDRLARAMETPHEQFALYFLDFDRFKIVNDSLGHDAGDQLLIEIARRLTASLQSPQCTSRCRAAVAARMGGDEFVILLEGLARPDHAVAFADYLLRLLAEPHKLKGYTVSSTASIGITTSQITYADPASALRDADNAMYGAKNLGRARYLVFDGKMHDAARARLVIENELRGAVDRNEMVLHYQPLVSIEDGRLRGFEALVRWNHPRRGLVMPEEFIACAEETGAIDELGPWALREAASQLQRWRARSPAAEHLVMSVNVSARQLVSRVILEQLDGVLAQTGIPPGALALEITESAVISDPQFTIQLLHLIKKTGVRIHLDDFGTGYTSMSYLHKMPVDGLKMDRSFMKSVSERRDYAAIVHAIVSLAQNLGMSVIAEGVECDHHVAMLQTMGCTCGQGYYFGKPVDARQAERLLDHRWGGSWAAAA